MDNKSVARKHHYVPQAYLAAFTSTGMKDGFFNVFDVQSGRLFRTSPTNVAAERDFNRIDIEGQPQDAVENALGGFESEAVNAIREVIRTQCFPCDRDWNLILNLLGLIAVRNPRLRQSFNESRAQVLRMIGQTLISDKKLWDGQMKKARAAGENFSDVSFEDFKSFVEEERYDIEFHPQGNLVVELKAFNAVLPLLGKRTWSVLVAPPDGPEFICSDHPVTLSSKSGRGGAIGYGLRQTEVFFPLSRNIGFYGTFEAPLKPVVNCRPMNVAIMNQRQINNAERQWYSALDNVSVWHDGRIRELRYGA